MTEGDSPTISVIARKSVRFSWQSILDSWIASGKALAITGSRETLLFVKAKRSKNFYNDSHLDSRKSSESSVICTIKNLLFSWFWE